MGARVLGARGAGFGVELGVWKTRCKQTSWNLRRPQEHIEWSPEADAGGAEVSPSRSLPSSGPQRKRPSFSAPMTRGRGAGQVGSSDTPVQEGWAGVRSVGASSLLPAAGA